MSPSRRHRAERVLQRRPQVLIAFVAVLVALTLWSVASRQTASVQPQAIAPGAIAAVDAQEASATCGGLGDRPGDPEYSAVLHALVCNGSLIAAGDE